MPAYEDMTDTDLTLELTQIETEYAQFKEKGLKLNMARGKPAITQLNLSEPLLDILGNAADCTSDAGIDCRNYGVADGLPEAKELMAIMLDDTPENVIIFGNASLSAMYDTIMRCWAFGTCGHQPWHTLDTIKWLCPVPGYDRHFGVTEEFGFDMINVPMTDDGPDMDVVEALVANDSSVKGIWCVPKYANPTGVTYSHDVVRRLAHMKCAASDFRIFWDNAYCVHDLYDNPDMQDSLDDIGIACRRAGNDDRYIKFASTSKITFPGAGISAMAASPAIIKETKAHMTRQTIGHDKLNQLRHVRFLKNADGLHEHMMQHAAILRPKFELVDRKLTEGLAGTGCGSWTKPCGGYFVSFDAPEHTASAIVELAKQAGVVLTGAGATYPYGKDPRDSNIRIAPTLPPLSELDEAMDVLVCCVKLARIRQLLAER